MRSLVKTTIAAALTTGVLSTNGFGVNILPSTLDIPEDKVKSFLFQTDKSIPTGITFEIKKLEKDKYGVITETELEEPKFIMNNPMVVLKPKETKWGKIKYLGEIPKVEEVYSIIFRERAESLNKQLNIKNHFSTKIYVGGSGNEVPTCRVEEDKIFIDNKNTKHFYIDGNKLHQVLVNGESISKEELVKSQIHGYYLPASMESVRTLSKKYPNNSNCEIRRVK